MSNANWRKPVDYKSIPLSEYGPPEFRGFNPLNHEDPQIMENTSGIKPMEYNCLVKPDVVEAKTKGGIILPDEVKEKDEFARTEGILVAVSPMAFSFSDWPDELADQKPKPGDRVVFSRYQATTVKGRDGADYWMMKDKNIAGVIE